MIFQPEGETRCPRRLTVRNRQRDCRIDGVQLRRRLRHHLEMQLGLRRYNLAIHFISARRMARLNEQHLNHSGPTDVITFDYSEPGADILAGELLVCPAVAVAQAEEYRTTWPEEIIRYLVHGILHLRGYDDRTPSDRRRMKREEDRLVAGLQAELPASDLLHKPARCRRAA